MPKKIDRTGERGLMNCGYWCEIINYIESKNIVVKFDKTGYVTSTTYDSFKKGKVVDRLQPSLYGIGIIGDNKTTDENGKAINSYRVWASMFTRCYEKKGRNKTYNDCYVCDEWKYYSNFKKWYDKNHYTIPNEKMCLDKDILIKGNKVYSPNTCVFVPISINLLFVKSNKIRGELPIGVSRSKSNKYRANISIKTPNGGYKTKQLGVFDTIEEAFNSYKIEKELYIKRIADKFKDKIPHKLYDAMYKYEVEITD